MMRTTIDLPDALYREAKVTALARGVPLRALVVEGLSQFLRGAEAAGGEPAWKRHVGTLSKEAADEMERFLREADFSRVQPEETP